MWPRVGGYLRCGVLLSQSDAVSRLYVAFIISTVTVFLMSFPAAFLRSRPAGVPPWHVKSARVTHVLGVVVLPESFLNIVCPSSTALLSFIWCGYSVSLLLGLCWGLACVRQSLTCTCSPRPALLPPLPCPPHPRPWCDCWYWPYNWGGAPVVGIYGGGGLYVVDGVGGLYVTGGST